MEIILFAVPFFFVLIAIEIGVDIYKGTGFYRVNDAIASLNLGVVSRMTEIAKALIPLVFYGFFHANFALFEIPNTIAVGIAAVIIYDFFYYWNHRFGHEINLLWAAHVVHHGSEEYNLTTALRQTSGGVFTWIFFIPMAIVGFDPALFISVAALNLVYQFWVHTRHIDKLGWADYVFVTPSNHRVHHAQNDIYLDRNYGGVFVIWDRLFGTFQEELDSEQPVYGVRKPLHSWNPVFANFQVYATLFADCIKTKRWRDKLLIWFKPTGWRPEDCADAKPHFDLSTFRKYEVPLSHLEKTYAALQYAVHTALALLFLLNVQSFPMSAQLLIATLVIAMCVSISGVMEHKTWACWTESIKHLYMLIAAFYWYQGGKLYADVIVIAAVANSAMWAWVAVKRIPQQHGNALD